MLELLRLTLRRARQERLPQLAGSLTLATLLSAVPLMAVGFALFTRVPALRGLGRAIEDQLLRGLLPGDLGRTVLASLHRFATNASGLTALGLLLTLASAVALLLSIEGALNRLWQVKRARPLPKRIGIHLLILAVGPLLVGAGLWAATAAVQASRGLVGGMPAPMALVSGLGPMLLAALALTTLFRFVPNTAVRLPDALSGAVLSALALEPGKRAFAAWVLKLPTYQAVYGALSALPVFLLWLYFSWLVTLAGGLLAANLPRAGARTGIRTGSRGGASRPARNRAAG